MKKLTSKHDNCYKLPKINLYSIVENELSEQIKQLEVIIPQEGLKENQMQFLRLFGLNTCCVATTCLASNIGRTIFYEWMKDNQVFAETIMNIREGLIDWAESKMYKAMRNDNFNAIWNFLITQGKKRGWSERFDIDLEKGTDRLIQSPEDKRLIAETRKKLALLDLLLVTDDRDKKLTMIEEFKK